MLDPATWLWAGVAYGALLWHPEPFFPYRVHEANLTLAADRPFDPAAGRAVLGRARARLATSPLYRPDRPIRAFVCQGEAAGRLFFNRSYGAGGVCFVPIPAVFLRPADVRANRLRAPSGGTVPPPRDLAYYVAHEAMHDLTGAYLGPARHHALPRWVREGLADYVGRQGSFTYARALAAYRAGAPEMDPACSGRYDRFLLLVAHCLEVEGWSVRRLLTAPPAEAAVEAALGR